MNLPFFEQGKSICLSLSIDIEELLAYKELFLKSSFSG